MLYQAALTGNPSLEDLINASVASEFFYAALFSHYWQKKGIGSDVIMGDYFGSIAIIYASKTNNQAVLSTFCEAIQDATSEEDDEYKEVSRLAKIYGASAYVGALLAGLDSQLLDKYYTQGEQSGLKLLSSLMQGIEANINENLFIEMTT